MNKLKQQIYSVLKSRYESKYGLKVSKHIKESFLKKNDSSLEANDVNFLQDENEKLLYFFFYKVQMMNELNTPFYLYKYHN